ncbi:hypothetical protein DIPPA_30454 [Diplonema papillatum]|nr:hypothetical protein DIPPA_30454 [Diplonema papillatum]
MYGYASAPEAGYSVALEFSKVLEFCDVFDSETVSCDSSAWVVRRSPSVLSFDSDDSQSSSAVSFAFLLARDAVSLLA